MLRLFFKTKQNTTPFLSMAEEEPTPWRTPSSLLVAQQAQRST
jgi:hypothetical protein